MIISYNNIRNMKAARKIEKRLEAARAEQNEELCEILSRLWDEANGNKKEFCDVLRDDGSTLIEACHAETAKFIAFQSGHFFKQEENGDITIIIEDNPKSRRRLKNFLLQAEGSAAHIDI